MKYSGGCHCGEVRFEVIVDGDIEGTECNCSICRKSGYLHLIVPASRFKLLRGEKSLVSYAFNTKTAKHLFCKRCGIKSFYVPRSNPEGYSVNIRCLDGMDPAEVRVHAFDGQHWEQNAAKLAPLSKETDN